MEAIRRFIDEVETLLNEKGFKKSFYMPLDDAILGADVSLVYTRAGLRAKDVPRLALVSVVNNRVQQVAVDAVPASVWLVVAQELPRFMLKIKSVVVGIGE